MICELMNESLVFLKRLLKWELSDVISLHSNGITSVLKRMRKTFPEWAKIKEFSNETMKSFESWANIDIALYKHFRSSFESTLKEQPQDFFEEVECLKEINKKVQVSCEDIFKTRRAGYIKKTKY